MTRPSKRELEQAIEALDTDPDESDVFGEPWVSWSDPEEERPEHGPVIDFTDIDT
jgi:hypothetical protein